MTFGAAIADFAGYLWPERTMSDLSSATPPEGATALASLHERMRQEFPRLWEMANQFDFAERLGGCSDPLYAEADAAMREIFAARTFIADFDPSVPA